MANIQLTSSRLHAIIKESIEHVLNENNNQDIETYYHGGSLKDDLYYSGVLWLTPQVYYAKEYAKDSEEPVIWEVQVNPNKLKPISIYGIEEIIGTDFDPYSPTKEEMKLVRQEGYNAYYMDYDSYDSEGLCLLSKEPIVSIRQLSREEYNMAEEW